MPFYNIFKKKKKKILRKKVYHVRFGNCLTPLKVPRFWVPYKDAIDLTSRWKVRFRQTFFQNGVQRVL